MSWLNKLNRKAFLISLSIAGAVSFMLGVAVYCYTHPAPIPFFAPLILIGVLVLFYSIFMMKVSRKENA